MRLAASLLLWSCVAGAQSDDRLAHGATTVLFERAHRAFALEVVAAIPAAEDRLRTSLGLELGDAPRTVRLVADQRALDARLREVTGRGAPDWAGAVAVSSRRLVLMRVDLPRVDALAVRSLLAHELTHLALEEKGEVRRVPHWLEEGFAQFAAGRRRPDEDVDLRPSAFFGLLFDPDELDAAFSQGEGAAVLAYAEAEAFLRRLAEVDRFGPGAPARLLKELQSGATLDQAIQALGGASFQAEWTLFVARLRADKSWMIAAMGQALLALGLVAVVLLATARRKRRRAALEEKWSEEDARRQAAQAADLAARAPEEA